jgi:hypothetical protein
MHFINNWGMILLAVYLILVGLASLAGLVIPSVIYGILALVAGILILIGR